MNLISLCTFYIKYSHIKRGNSCKSYSEQRYRYFSIYQFKCCFNGSLKIIKIPTDNEMFTNTKFHNSKCYAPKFAEIELIRALMVRNIIVKFEKNQFIIKEDIERTMKSLRTKIRGNRTHPRFHGKEHHCEV